MNKKFKNQFKKWSYRHSSSTNLPTIVLVIFFNSVENFEQKEKNKSWPKPQKIPNHNHVLFFKKWNLPISTQEFPWGYVVLLWLKEV